jgi:hypothetical protein
MHKPCNEMTPHEILADSLEMLLSLMGNVQSYMRQFDEPEIQVHAETLDKMADMVQRWRDEYTSGRWRMSERGKKGIKENERMIVLNYRDDGPLSICGQDSAITTPRNLLYIVDSMEEARELHEKMEAITSRKNPRAEFVWDDYLREIIDKRKDKRKDKGE